MARRRFRRRTRRAVRPRRVPAPPDLEEERRAADRERGELEPVQCPKCSANLAAVPGAGRLECPYCGHRESIESPDYEAEDLDLREELDRLDGAPPEEKAETSDCPGCGAVIRLGKRTIAAPCPYCGTPVNQPDRRAQMRPQVILPFRVTRERAERLILAWLGGLRLAPSRLAAQVGDELRLQAVFVPFWLFDCPVRCRYRGQRGIWKGSGNDRHLEWFPVSGRVEKKFHNIDVPAGGGAPRLWLTELSPWPMARVEPFQEERLAGLRAEGCRLGVRGGWALARREIIGYLRARVKLMIGGDEQRITCLRQRRGRVTCQLALAPLWTCVFRAGGRRHLVALNGRTGELVGDRPYSLTKFIALIAGVAVAAAALLLLLKGPGLVVGFALLVILIRLSPLCARPER